MEYPSAAISLGSRHSVSLHAEGLHQVFYFIIYLWFFGSKRKKRLWLNGWAMAAMNEALA
jgi:hypothetical protein